MKEKELINKVEIYLKNTNTIFDKNSVHYVGIREKHTFSNEEPKDYYFLAFEALADKNNIYSTNSYFVYIDKITEKIRYIIGPQSFEEINK